MKYTSLIFALTILSFSMNSEAARASKVSVDIQKIFVPAFGYDDNDSVQIVLDGQLPNACYTIEKTIVKAVSNKKNTFRVGQIAVRSDDGICTQGGQELPIHLKATVPYSTEITLGRLSAGEYTLLYKNSSSKHVIEQTFSVEEAPVATIDSLPYARVSNALVADIIGKAQDVLITLTGTLNSSCTQLNSKVEAKKVNDVVVMLPTENFFLGPICLQVIRNFSNTINLGKLKEGRYLAHIRSKNGQAVNRLFSVVAKTPEN